MAAMAANDGVFQSPLSRGTTPDVVAKGAMWEAFLKVSIPSKSGHSSRLYEKAKLYVKKLVFQSPLSRGTPPDLMLRALLAATTINVSIPSKSGHSSRRKRKQNKENENERFNPL